MTEASETMKRAEKALIESRGNEKVTINRDDLVVLRVLAEVYLVMSGRHDELKW